MSAHDQPEMTSAVLWLLVGCAQGAGQTSDRPSLLVVDSLSFLVSPVMGPGGAEDGHALMICLGRALKALAQKHTLAVITTNHIVGGGAA